MIAFKGVLCALKMPSPVGEACRIAFIVILKRAGIDGLMKNIE